MGTSFGNKCENDFKNIKLLTKIISYDSIMIATL